MDFGSRSLLRCTLAATVVLAALVLTAPALRAASKLKIVTATTDLAELASEVGGDRVEVESIARGYQDPHFVEAKPSFLLKLRRADLLIVVGLQLEIGWLPPLITQCRQPQGSGQRQWLPGRLAVRGDPGDTRPAVSRAPWATSTPSAIRTTGSTRRMGGASPRGSQTEAGRDAARRCRLLRSSASRTLASA